jgi:GNAT superfamily N-acetyltransferase
VTRVAIGVRPVTPADRDAVVALVPRLRAFGDAPLRSPDALDRAEREALERALQAAPDATDAESDAVLLVAELEGLGVAGIAYVQTATDYFTQERHGHLAVDERGEGQGVGRALLAATERWCEARGHRFVTLNVFADNLRARAVYERAGFAPDTLRYYKELPSSVADEDRR